MPTCMVRQKEQSHSGSMEETKRYIHGQNKDSPSVYLEHRVDGRDWCF